MDARGYGRRSDPGSASRRLATGATVGGLLVIAAGLYGALDAGSLLGLGLPLTALGAVLCALGMAVGGRRTSRSRYRPDLWRRPEWVVAGSGALALGALAIAGVLHTPGLTVSFFPLVVPALPLLPVAGLCVAAAPVLAAATPASRPSATRSVLPTPSAPAATPAASVPSTPATPPAQVRA
jgi:energy-coupling factor transport system permease protein